jgi:lysozyme family protein
MVRREGLQPEDLGLKDFAPGSFHHLTEETSRSLYKRCFWERYGYERIDNQDCATKVFDAAVNMGPHSAHLLAQKACNCGNGILVVDGILGQRTVDAINSCDPQWWLKSMACQMAGYYRTLVIQRPTLLKYLHAWLHRASWTHP